MIHYVKGDATLPQGGGDKIILHCCNNCDGWGAGFTGAVNKRWPDATGKQYYAKSAPEYLYRHSFHSGKGKLGDVQFCPMETKDGSNLWIANLVCQDGYKSAENPVPLSYVHLGRCLDLVEEFLTEMKTLGSDLQVICPKMGTGLAGGNWDLIASHLRVRILHDITVYEL